MLAEERALREVRHDLAAAGLTAGICVRDLRTGRELALDADRQLPLASVVKVPLAAAVLLRAEAPAAPFALSDSLTVTEEDRTPGPSGLSRFRHRAEIAVEDLLYLALGLSDNTATDLLFRLVPPATVTEELRRRGHVDVTVRHPIQALHDSLLTRLGADQEHLALALAARAATGEGGSLVPQLDVSQANSGSARGLVGLLADIWSSTGAWAERLRALMGTNLLRQRLAPDLESDAARWSSKTGTFLTLRHEAGVLEHDDGQRFAIAVLSESRVAATVQPAAEAALGAAARRLHDVLRDAA
ncbi:serine hydrolase [Desertihabitans brevis]|uniref:serine hydrolase n=1 Tax=Desertihabitans brevis TaxID=2268447 RepID=UPI0018F79BF6|nr:serine hydrolase [Desertihabitans brevis]